MPWLFLSLPAVGDVLPEREMFVLPADVTDRFAWLALVEGVLGGDVTEGGRLVFFSSVGDSECDFLLFLERTSEP